MNRAPPGHSVSGEVAIELRIPLRVRLDEPLPGHFPAAVSRRATEDHAERGICPLFGLVLECAALDAFNAGFDFVPHRSRQGRSRPGIPLRAVIEIDKDLPALM